MKFQKVIRAVVLLSIVFSLNLIANAQHGEWEYLGKSRVDGIVDHDKISVNNGGTFRAIQFGIKGGDIVFQRVVVHFENGNDTDVQVREHIPAGGRTRAIDLPGDRRRIKSVEFWYEKASYGSNKPILNLWGRR